LGIYDALLTRLAEDRSSGSERLASEALAILKKAVLDKSLSNNDLSDLIYGLTTLIEANFPELVPLAHLSERLKALSDGDLRASLGCFVKESIEKIGNEISSLAILGANLIPQNSTVATISHSKTVLQMLSSAAALARNFHVIIGISEPGCEGRLMAKALAKSDIEVTLVPDAALGYAVERSDIVFVGADAVTADYFINKIGTLNMALAARHFNIPFYVLARLEKFTSSRRIPNSRSFADPTKLKPPKSVLINVKAPLFERVPLALVEGIVTESGIIKPENRRIDSAEVKDD